MKTYDRDKIADAVRTIAPEVTVEVKEQFMEFRDDERTMGLLWTTHLPFDLYRCRMSKRGRSIFRAICDELDAQDAARGEGNR